MQLFRRGPTNPGLVFAVALALFVGALAAQLSPAAAQDANEPERSIEAYRQRMAQQPAPEADSAVGPRRRAPASRPVILAAQTGQVENQAGREQDPDSAEPTLPRESLLSEPFSASQPSSAEVLSEVPDPIDAAAAFVSRLERVRKLAREERSWRNYERVIARANQYLARFKRPIEHRMTLVECIQRTLENNYTIRAEAYGPAISRSKLVEAEAIFDAVFFLDTSYANQDKPTGLDPPAQQTDVRNYSGGIRKLLPTGMQASVAIGQTRSKSDPDPSGRLLNPVWDTNFVATITQPLMRGFGLDYNRSGIEIQRMDLKITQEAFAQQVRERLYEVERAYWLLAQARRTVMILAETTGQNAVTYENVVARRPIDATEVEIANSSSNWKQSEVRFNGAVRAVKDAEDTLKNLMNDPDLKLSDEIEIIPIETPFTSPLAVDHFAEVRTALDERSEIRQARFAIEQARIATARAKNEVMPNLDLTFQYEVDGRANSADVSFDRFTSDRYRSYNVRLVFQVPIGQRAAQARHKQALDIESQLVVRLKQAMDGIVQEVNIAVRAMKFDYESIPTQWSSIIDADRNIRAFQDRSPDLSPSFLQTELSAIQNLATARTELLRLVTEYNVAIVALERAKGTLLPYNNVALHDGKSRR